MRDIIADWELEKSMFLDIPRDTLDKYRLEPKHEIKSISDYTTQLMDYFASDPNEKGAFLPFKGSHELRFRSSEITLFVGPNFTGKSSLLTMAMLYMLRGTKYTDKPQKFLLISPEMTPVQNLARICQQTCAKLPGQMTDADVGAVCAWAAGRLFILNHTGQIDVSDMCATLMYAREELGITSVILDNLTVMRLPGGDTNQAQQDLMSQFVEVTRATDLHLFLVCHTRKPQPGEKPDRYSIRGSSTLSDLADNILYTERRFDKENALLDLSLDEEQRGYLAAQPDTVLHCLKQRHGTGWIGQVKLWYDPYSMRWSTDKHAPFLAFNEIQGMAELGGTNSRGYQHA